MKSKALTYGILRAIGILAGVALLCYFLYTIRSILFYIMIAAVVSLIGRPLVFFLKNKLHFPNMLAVISVLVLVLFFFIGVIGLFFPILMQQSEYIAQIDMDAFRGDLNALNLQVKEYLGVDELDLVQAFKQSVYFQDFDLKVVSDYMSVVFGTMGTVLIGLFSVIFIAFFLLKDSRLLLNSILVFSNHGDEERFQRVFQKIKNLLSRYFVGLTFQILILFVLYAILLFVFEVDNPIAIAFICAFLNIVPYLGPIVAGGLMIVFVFSSNLGADFSTIILPKALYVLGGYCVAQLLDNFINQPLIFGKSVRAHPLEIFLVILIAGLLSGIIGMIVAIPFYTALKVIAKESLSEYKIVQKLTNDL